MRSRSVLKLGLWSMPVAQKKIVVAHSLGRDVLVVSSAAVVSVTAMFG